jgi:aminoglycoside phosphotransferase (APT) family kinase protein
MTRLPSPVPHGRTAHRLEWAHLPPALRATVEGRIGTAVVDARSCTSGFTPGLASVLEGEDGSRHFVKAASVRAQRPFAEAYREEARTLAALPPEAPAPRLLWTHDTDDWVVLGIEHVAARAPDRPWSTPQLEAVLDTLEHVADVLTPVPPGLDLTPAGEELGGWAALWSGPAEQGGWPGLGHAGRLAEAAALAERFPAVSAGNSLVHTDVRDDNVLLLADGTALLCDWNWPVAGAPWLDTVWAMVGPRGDGLDVDAALSRRRLTRDVPREDVDTVIALVAGYLLAQAGLPVPASSPHLRDVQRWQGEVCWQWLAERRGWD